MESIKCPVCGNLFVAAPYHVYTARIRGKKKTFCGWNCMRAAEREKEAGKRVKEVKRDENR